MPTYEYECSECGVVLEVFHGIHEEPVPICEQCGQQKMKRIISSGIGVHFKGGGFYVTDSRKKPSGASTEKQTSKEN